MQGREEGAGEGILSRCNTARSPPDGQHHIQCSSQAILGSDEHFGQPRMGEKGKGPAPWAQLSLQRGWHLKPHTNVPTHLPTHTSTRAHTHSCTHTCTQHHSVHTYCLGFYLPGGLNTMCQLLQPGRILASPGSSQDPQQQWHHMRERIGKHRSELCRCERAV